MPITSYPNASMTKESPKKILMRVALCIAIPVFILAGIGTCTYYMVTHGYYTSCGSHVYTIHSSALASPRFDSLQLSGKGIKIGTLDVGYGGFKTNKWTNRLKVAAYKDFVAQDTVGFFDDETDHGTIVCSNIGGTLPGNDTLRGLAYNAEFYLAKVDMADREPRADEERMMQGIVWLVEQGVDIISSSVAYTVFDDFRNYTPQMLDGKSSRLSRFVDSVLTANPDLIFVQSAGNEGKEDWKYICFPGDVCEVITVGSCANADGTIHFPRSSIGREESGYIKPDVVTEPSPIGTSFSTPTITGLCAALLEWKRMDRRTLIQLLHRSGTKADSPDYKLGYGRPQTEKLVEMLK